MARTLYYSSKYQAANQKKEKPAAVAVPAQQRRFAKVVPIILIVCLLLATMTVLVVPLMVGGASSGPAKELAISQVAKPNYVSYATPEEARAALGSKALLPVALPDGFEVTDSRVVEGGVLELIISSGKNTVVFRSAAGSDDVSNNDYETFAYTATEQVDGVTRGYAGVSDKKLNLVIWVQDGYSYALMAESGLDAATMKTIAQSVA